MPDKEKHLVIFEQKEIRRTWHDERWFFVVEDVVQALVDGIARSGLWLDKSKPHREDAADFVGRFYYNQKPALLRWALTKPLDRVMYTPLAPYKADFDLVRDLMMETGVLDKKIDFDEYTDTRFSDGALSETAWKYEAGMATAR